MLTADLMGLSMTPYNRSITIITPLLPLLPPSSPNGMIDDDFIAPFPILILTFPQQN